MTRTKTAILTSLLAALVAATVAIDQTSADTRRGKLRHAEIAAAVKKARSKIDACLDYSGESGELFITITIASDGAVTRAKPSWSTSSTSCIADEFEKLSFRSSNGASEFKYALKFAPPKAKKPSRSGGVMNPWELLD